MQQQQRQAADRLIVRRLILCKYIFFLIQVVAPGFQACA